VNIHHFILDGALWKLRDSRISALLIDRGAKPPESRKKVAPAPSVARGIGSRVFSSPAFRVSLVALLFLWGGMDQVRFALGTHEGDLSALISAARMNPYDSVVQARIASAQSRAGDQSAAMDALERAVDINPYDARAQQACARALLEDGRYEDAYERYAKMLELFPRDPNALVNYGLLAARLGHPEEAMDSWEKAVTVDPNQPNAHLYLAEAFDQRGEFAAAARHWDAFLRFAAANPDDPAAGIEQQTSAAIQLADDESRIHRTDEALAGYRSAIAIAARASENKLESLALAHLADLQEKTGDVKSAADSYQRGLALDAKSADPHGEALDWFNYGQFLRRHGLPDDLAYACLLHAEQLLGSTGGTDLDTVKTIRRQVESRLGNKAGASQKDLPALLARAGGLPTQSF
jgi:tetratricopeptide (TPR) repeat protein